MSSPATHLRAPLLWLLFPFMAGLTAAKLWALPRGGLIPLGIAATTLAGLSLWLAKHASVAKAASHAPDEQNAEVVDSGSANPGWLERWRELTWAISLCGAISAGGFAMLHWREPLLHQWETQPPREITLTLRVDQLFPGAPTARSISGLGKIVATSERDRELTGRRVYFSALRRISVPPARSGSYVLRGILEPLPREPAEASFNDYLENLGIRQTLTRARIVSEITPPNAFRSFCNRTMSRFEKSLRVGLEHHPEVSSLYLAMLLGEKAVLSPDQQNAFMRSGTFHIFSISGLHVGVIALALHSVLRLLQVPRRATAALSLLILWFYLEVTGINSPAVRSFLMIAFLFGSQVFRLPGNALAALSAAALITLLLDPLQLFSAGFQMSYAVVTALVIMGAPLSHKVLARWRPFSVLPKMNWRWYHRGIEWSGRGLIGSLTAGWVAFLASTPSGIGYFQLFSPGSLFANLIIVPLSSLAIVAGFISLLSGQCGVWSLSVLFNSSSAMIIIAMDWLAQHGTRLPGVYFDAHFIRPWLAPASLTAMTGLMFAGLAGRWSPRYGGYWPPALLLVIILISGVKFGKV